VPVAGPALAGPIVAFAGIGRPEKFFRTIVESGANLIERHEFPDHYRYGARELARLEDEAALAGARLLTTAKDAARLPPQWRNRIAVLEVEVEWRDAAALEALIDRVMERAHG
jgi:tetraacyldisaccharide 4'-kinase